MAGVMNLYKMMTWAVRDEVNQVINDSDKADEKRQGVDSTATLTLIETRKQQSVFCNAEDVGTRRSSRVIRNMSECCEGLSRGLVVIWEVITISEWQELMIIAFILLMKISIEFSILFGCIATKICTYGCMLQQRNCAWSKCIFV